MSNNSRSRLGSKRELRPGVWEVLVSGGFRRDGTRRRVSRTVHGTEADADRAVWELAAEMGRSPSVGDPMTLDEYFWGAFLPDRQATTTKANWTGCEGNYRNHIAPYFGDCDMSSITYREVRAWVDGLPPQSAPNYVRTFRAILNQARYDGVIDDSPMDGRRFRMPRGRDTTPKPVWGPSEVAEALSRPAFRASQLFPLWCLMCGGGLSRSEALAVDWEGIRWQSATGMDGRDHWTAYVSIERAVTSKDGEKEPKNSRRYRSVPIPPLFADPLRGRMATGPVCQSERYRKAGNVPTGHRLTADRIPAKWKGYFAPGGCLEGLPFVWLNRMRATYATIMQGAGVDSTIINAMQGRSSNSQVLYANYLNPQNETFDAAARAMQGRVAGA